MVTMRMHKPISIKWLVLLPVVAVLLFALSQPSRHAVDQHGASAWSTTRRMGDIDPDDDDTWSKVCPDGRRYTFKSLPDGNAWDVSIDGIDGGNITRFVCTSADWIARKLEWCE